MHYAWLARASLDFRSLASSALRFSLNYTRIARCRCWHSSCEVFGYQHLEVDSRRQACYRARGTSYAKEYAENEMVNKLLSGIKDDLCICSSRPFLPTFTHLTGKPEGIKK